VKLHLKLLPVALLLAACSSTTRYSDGTDQWKETSWDWYGTIVFFLIVVVAPIVITHLFWRMPRGYSRSYMPTSDKFRMDRYIMTITGPTGDELPGSMGRSKGQFITALQFEASRTARIHRRMGKNL
jgi:hypothetical protein